LDKDTFQPKNGTQTSVLFLRKKTNEEKQTEMLSKKMRRYPVFMAMAEKIGHDKRGNTIYKRDEEGNEIIIKRKEKVKDEESGKIIEREIDVQEKIVYDETPDIAKLFAEWKNDKKYNFPEFDF
jgi:type I restriction enzyme M protein